MGSDKEGLSDPQPTAMEIDRQIESRPPLLSKLPSLPPSSSTLLVVDVRALCRRCAPALPPRPPPSPPCGVVWCGPAVVAVMLNSDGVGIDMRSVQFSSALPETTSCTAIRIFPYPLQHDSPSSSRPFASPLARAALAGVAFAVATLPFTNFRMAAGRLEGARK